MSRISYLISYLKHEINSGPDYNSLLRLTQDAKSILSYFEREINSGPGC